MRKKVFAALLAVCMVVAMLPVSAFAEDAPTTVHAPKQVDGTEVIAADAGNDKVGYVVELAKKELPTFRNGSHSTEWTYGHWVSVTLPVGNNDVFIRSRTGEPITKEVVDGFMKLYKAINDETELPSGYKTFNGWGGSNDGKYNYETEDGTFDMVKATGFGSDGVIPEKTWYPNLDCMEDQQVYIVKVLNPNSTIEGSAEQRIPYQFDFSNYVLQDPVENVKVYFVDDEASYKALPKTYHQFAEGKDVATKYPDVTTYPTFPWLVVEYDRWTEDGANGVVNYQVTLPSGITANLGAEASSPSDGKNDKARYQIWSLKDDFDLNENNWEGEYSVKIYGEHTPNSYYPKYSESTPIFYQGSKSYDMKIPTLKLEVTSEQVESDKLTFSAPDKNNKITVTGSIKYVLESDKHYPVDLKFIDTEAGKALVSVQVGSNSVKPFTNKTATDTIAFKEEVDLKDPIDVKVLYGDQKEFETDFNKRSITYQLDFSGVTLAKPTDVKTDATVKVEDAEVKADGTATTAVDTKTVTDAIDMAVKKAEVNSETLGVNVTLEKVSITASLAKDDESNVSGSELVVAKDGVGALLEKDAQALSITAPVTKKSENETVTVVLPQEVLKQTNTAGADLIVKVTKTAKEADRLTVGTGNKASKVLAEYDVTVVGQEIKDLKKDIEMTFKVPANAVAVAYVKADGTLEKVADIAKNNNGEITVKVNHLTKFVFLTEEQATNEDIVPTKYDIKLGEKEEYDGVMGFTRKITVTTEKQGNYKLYVQVKSGDAGLVSIEDLTIGATGKGEVSISYADSTDGINVILANTETPMKDGQPNAAFKTYLSKTFTRTAE